MTRKPFCLLALLLLAPVAQAHPAWGIVRDPLGNVFYTDLERVYRIAPDGRRTVAVEGVHTHGLAVDAAGHVYGEHVRTLAGDRYEHRVWRRSPDGRLTDVLPRRPGFPSGYGLTLGPGGAVLWAEGDAVLTRPGFGRGGGRRVAGALGGTPAFLTWTGTRILFARDGRLWTIGGDGRPHARTPDLRERGGPEQAWLRGDGMYAPFADVAGNVYATCYRGRMVKRVDAQGRVTVVARSPAPYGPVAGLVAPGGDLWLLEVSDPIEGGGGNRHRVRRIGPDGREATWGP